MEGPGVLVRACLVSSHRIVFELAYVRMKVIERILGSPMDFKCRDEVG